MTVKTQLKAGALSLNHNETQRAKRSPGLKVKTQLKAGKIMWGG